MESKQNQDSMELIEGIDFKDLFLVLWRNKIIIICFTVIVSLLSFTYSKYMISTEYRAKISVQFSMPSSYTTKYGEFLLTNGGSDVNALSALNMQYANLVKNDVVLTKTIKDLGEENQISAAELSSRITLENISGTTVPSIYNINIISDDTTKALNSVKVLYDNYINYVDVKLHEDIVNYFNKIYNAENLKLNNEITTFKEVIKRFEQQLEQIPYYLPTDNIIEENGNYDQIIVYNSVLNPQYTHLSSTIMNYKEQLIEKEYRKDINSQMLIELNNEKSMLTDYKNNNYIGEYKTDIASVINDYTSILVQPTDVKISPDYKKYILIGAVIGCMIGIFISLIRGFWFRKKEDITNKNDN